MHKACEPGVVDRLLNIVLYTILIIVIKTSPQVGYGVTANIAASH
jgi:hypothetical protein